MLLTKSVWSPKAESDGLRILVTRFRGRGMPVDLYDVWMASLGPSEKLLREFLDGNISWTGFSRRYRDEIFSSPEFDKANRTIKNHGQKFTLRLIRSLAEKGDVTLLCQCDEEQQNCHRHILQKVILSDKI